MNRIDHAFQVIPRINFLPPAVSARADADVPLPIGYGQTNSQPSVVYQMLDWLDIHPGQKVLDVGSGSGWTAALMAQLVGHEGSVYAVEKIPQLVRFGRRNCRRTGVINVRFFTAGGGYGLPRFSPYDRILVSASASRLPQDLLDQLGRGGRMVIPIRDSIHVITKVSETVYEDTYHAGYAFVPLV